MVRLMDFPEAEPRSADVDAWLAARAGEELGALAARLFGRLRACGADVSELMHDGQATACVGGAAFAYVSVHRAHVNLGFFAGSALPDPAGLLEGSGRFMRHVKLRPGRLVDDGALRALIEAGYARVRDAAAARVPATP
ncbi:MAG TPA: DUF1801 domain-containing protein [Myxococcota bacterium]|nr:DUF1801 domain-containing protein [Myxococcota bacterium]